MHKQNTSAHPDKFILFSVIVLHLANIDHMIAHVPLKRFVHWEGFGNASTLHKQTLGHGTHVSTPHPRWVGLQGGQVVLQGETAPVVQHCLHPSEVSLDQLLFLTGCLLLQRLHHGLEVLQRKQSLPLL